jgi:hypothetical protein
VVAVEIRARPHRVETRELRGEHDFVDRLLRPGEAAAHRKGSRDVRRVALILAPGVDQQELAVLQLPAVLAVVEHARVRAARDDRRIGDRLRAAPQELVGELRFDLVFVPAGAGAIHRPPVSRGGNGRRATHQGDLVLVLHETQRIDRLPHVDDLFGRGDACANPLPHFVQEVGDLVIPRGEQAERRVQRRPVGREIRQQSVKLVDRVRLVEAEDLPRRVGPVAKPVPDLPLLVLFAAEQHVPVAVRIGDEGDDRVGLGKTRHVIEIAVVPIREHRVAIARCFRGGGDEGQATAGLLAHPLRDRRAPIAINLVIVVHGDALT